MAWQKGTAQDVTVTFYSGGEPTAPTGALTATISKDGGAYAAIGGTCTQVAGEPTALLELSAADTNCDSGSVKIVDGGGTADDRYVEFVTEANYTSTVAGYIDAAISSRSTLTAAQVWAYSTRTLSSITALLSDIWTYATRTLTEKTGFALSAAGNTAVAEAVDAELTSEHGDGQWGQGEGSSTITVTVQDGDGTLQANTKVTVNNQSETGVALAQITDENGEATFYGTDGQALRAIVGSTAAHAGGATNFTVSGATAVTVTVTANTLPAPASPDLCVVFDDEIKVEADAPFGASEVTVKIVDVAVEARTDATANAQRSIMGTEYTTDATGRWSFQVAKALNGHELTIQKSYTNAAGLTQSESWIAIIDLDQANDDDQICWSDLDPARG